MVIKSDIELAEDTFAEAVVNEQDAWNKFNEAKDRLIIAVKKTSIAEYEFDNIVNKTY